MPSHHILLGVVDSFNAVLNGYNSLPPTATQEQTNKHWRAFKLYAFTGNLNGVS